MIEGSCAASTCGLSGTFVKRADVEYER